MLLLSNSENSINSLAHIWFLTFSGTKLLRGIASEKKVFLLIDALSCVPITWPSILCTVPWTAPAASVAGLTSVLESILGSTLLHPPGTCESGTNWTCGVAAAARRAWVTAVLIAAIISRVSCPSPLRPRRTGGVRCDACGPDLVSSAGFVLLRFAARS